MKEAARNKGVECPLDELLEVDEKKRLLHQQVDQLRTERNRASAQIAQCMAEQKKGRSRSFERSGSRIGTEH